MLTTSMPSRLVLSVVMTLAVVGAQDMLTTRRIDLTLSEGTSMAAAVSPDRRSIAIDLLGNIWVLPIRGGEAKRITPELLEARQPTWSPDSQSIAFQGYEDGAWHIYIVNREGGDPRPVTQGEFDDREPAWSHDGSRIAFSTDRADGISTIWEIALATGALRRVTTRTAWMPAWAPNDEFLMFFSANQEVRPDGVPFTGLWMIGAAGGEPQMISGNATLVAAAISPDGRRVASTTANGHLVVDEIGAPGGRTLTPASERDEDVFPFRPSWISRTEFVYTADGHIKRRSIGGAASIVPFTAQVPLRRSSYTIARRELEPSTPQRLTGIVHPAVSPDGSRIAFTAMGDLWMLPAGGTPVQITNDEAFELDPAWSPDGTQLAFVSDRGGHMDLWIRDLRRNTDTQATRERDSVSGPAWSRDGSQIAYLAGRRAVRTVRIKPGECRGGAARGGAAGELGRPTWAPGCRSVAVGALFPYSDRYREGLNQVLLYSHEGASWSQSLLFPGHSAGNRESGGPVWSPNGTHMAFVTEGKLWVVAVDGEGGAIGPPDVVADDLPESPSWEGDSRHIVYQTAKGLRRIVADGSPPEPVALNLTWRADPAPERVVVHAGHVLDGVLEALHGESDIIVERGIIRAVQAHRDDLHAGVVVDAPNDTVMPGLVEMHAHLDDGYGANFGRIWLAYGVTSVRIPSISAYAGLEQREAFDAGRRPGPRVFLAGDPFDGVRAYYPGGIAVTSEAQLDQELDRASTLGVDFFKTYVRLPDRLQQRIVDYAHDRGKPVTSHEIYPAIAFGIDGVEHLRGTSRRGYSPKLSATNRAYQDVVDLLTKSGVTLTPTIGIQGAFRARAAGDKTLLYDQRFALFPLPVVATLADLAGARPDPAADLALKPYEALLKAVVEGGGKIVAGTDAPIVPYGLGLHVELEAYVHAGMTPFQALQTATSNAAQALGVGDVLGTIQPGKVADFAFVSGDPLIDIRNTRGVKRVMKGGRVYTVTDLVSRR